MFCNIVSNSGNIELPILLKAGFSHGVASLSKAFLDRLEHPRGYPQLIQVSIRTLDQPGSSPYIKES